MDLIEKYLSRKNKTILLSHDIMDKKKAIRIPTAKGSQFFKDKKKYNRKIKHKIKYA